MRGRVSSVSGYELEVLAAPGMERVRHPDASVPITRIGRS
jgi:hypothetical protein